MTMKFGPLLQDLYCWLAGALFDWQKPRFAESSQKEFLSSGVNPKRIGFAEQEFTGSREFTLSCGCCFRAIRLICQVWERSRGGLWNLRLPGFSEFFV